MREILAKVGLMYTFGTNQSFLHVGSHTKKIL